MRDRTKRVLSALRAPVRLTADGRDGAERDRGGIVSARSLSKPSPGVPTGGSKICFDTFVLLEGFAIACVTFEQMSFLESK